MGLLNLDGIRISPLEQVAGNSILHRDSEAQRTAKAFIADDNGNRTEREVVQLPLSFSEPLSLCVETPEPTKPPG